MALFRAPEGPCGGLRWGGALYRRTPLVSLLIAAMVTMGGAWSPPSHISGRAWLFLVLSGLATGASWQCYFRALKLGEAARMAPVDELSVAVFGVIFLGERLSTLSAFGVVLIAAGSVLVVLG